MKTKLLLSLSAVLTILANTTAQVSVTGYAFLEGQSNHANIKVRFIPESPSATLDSTYTNALGYFEHMVNEGEYTIQYEKDGYQNFRRWENTLILENFDAGTATVMYLGTIVSSSTVSGVWDGIVSINNDITILQADSLVIAAGSKIRFLGNYNIYVYGYLEAKGTASQKIEFTSAPENQILANGQWQGIDFYDASDDNSIIAHAIIRYAVDGVHWNNAKASLSNSEISNCSQYGLHLLNDEADPTITNVEVHHTTSHGMYTNHGDPVIDGLNIHHSSQYGAYYYNYAYGTIKNSSFNNNSSHGILFVNWASPSLDSCDISGNSSWGIRVDYAQPSIQNSLISNNTGYGICYNHDNNTWISPYLYNNIIEENTSWGVYFRRYVRRDAQMQKNIVRNNGGGVYIWHYCSPEIFDNEIVNNANIGVHVGGENWSSPHVHHNIIAYNNGDGIHKNYRGGQDFHFNTIYNNNGDGIEINDNNETEKITNNIIVDNTGYGIRANAAIETLQYNNIYQNQIGEISNLANVPASAWDFISFNPNGAPADIYLNINEDPEFTFSDTLDFSLKPSSVCINAGDAAVKDPDGTRADIGALYQDNGRPHMVGVIAYGNNSVTINWEPVLADSLVSYNVYYKVSTTANYTLFNNTTNTTISVTGLTNNVLYDFTVTGVYPGSESVLPQKSQKKPVHLLWNSIPMLLIFAVSTDTVEQVLTVINTGTRDLNIVMPYGAEKGFARFDGSYDYIYPGNHSNLDGMEALTIECWIRNNSSAWTEPIGKHYTRYQMTMEISNNRFGMYKGFEGGNHYQHFYGYHDFEVGEWYHLAVTWTKNTIKFYVNGEMVNEYNNAISDPIPTGGYNFEMGRRAGTWDYQLNGDLAEVRVWNKVRTDEELSLYKDFSLEGNETGLVGYWPLHKDYSDYSIYARHATVYGNVHLRSEKSPLYEKIPYLLNKKALTLAPGEQDALTFKFWNIGSTGTYVYTAPIATNTIDTALVSYEMSVTYNELVPSTPVHFAPVPSTGLPYTIVITGAEIDGATIEIGDEIAVFDGQLCVGAGVFDGNFNFVVTAWKSDPGNGLAGFTTGNPISFKIFDTSADLEATTHATFGIGDGTFGYGQFTTAQLSSTITPYSR
ncbi:MAG: hypothetical protein HC896_01075 [Bacteroidales bacterium]|nr:hypothetical protein [Bacteroidales bacterium]